MKKIMILSIVVFVFAYSGKVMAITVTANNSGDALVANILGSGITVSNISLIGRTTQQGTFTDGLSSVGPLPGIGIDEGIILTSGIATLAEGPNTYDDATGLTGTGPNQALSDLISGADTFDQNVLSFDFESASGDLFFNYVFASEEYNEWTTTEFNDVFAFFVDGVNIALIPGTNVPVSVNNVNGGNPFGDANASNPGLFNNNDLNDGGPFFNIEYDGFTDVFTAQVIGLSDGIHLMEMAIADTADLALDSAVFIQAGSFSDGRPIEEPIPEPTTIALLGVGLAGLAGVGARRKWKKKKVDKS